MKKVLILEDEVSIRSFVVINLKRAGYEAIEAGTGREALERLKENPDTGVAILDIMLPEEDGLSILRKLRADPDTRATPVMMLTAKGTEYDTVLALDAGADDYVQKPFRMMELLSRIRALIRRSEGYGTPAGAVESGRAFGSVARPAPGPRGWKRCDTDVEGI